jgi:hypothetical protein
MIFALAGRRFIQPRPVTLFGVTIQSVDITHHLGATLDKRLTWSHIGQVSRSPAQRMGLLGPLLDRRSELSVRNEVLLYKQLIRPLIDYACPVWRSAARTHIRILQVLQPKCRRRLRAPLGTSVTGRFRRIWVFRYSSTTSEP